MYMKNTKSKSEYLVVCISFDNKNVSVNVVQTIFAIHTHAPDLHEMCNAENK